MLKHFQERQVKFRFMSTAAYAIDERIKFQNFCNSNYRYREVSEAMRNLHLAKIIQLIYPTTYNSRFKEIP